MMPPSTTFDPHEFVQALTAANMPVEQAEVLAKTYANILTDNIATKEDIRILRQEIRQEIQIAMYKTMSGTIASLAVL